MLYLPSWPKWDGVHVLIIHFPIALLSIVPLFVLLTAFIRPYRKGLSIATFVLLLLGTIGAWLATATGGPAAHATLSAMPKVQREHVMPLVHHHAELGNWTRNIFTLPTVIFFFMLLVPLFKQVKGKVSVVALLVFFVLTLPGIFFLIDTGDAGAMLVHKYGLQAHAFPASAKLTPAGGGHGHPTSQGSAHNGD